MWVYWSRKLMSKPWSFQKFFCHFWRKVPPLSMGIDLVIHVLTKISIKASQVDLVGNDLIGLDSGERLCWYITYGTYRWPRKDFSLNYPQIPTLLLKMGVLIFRLLQSVFFLLILFFAHLTMTNSALLFYLFYIVLLQENSIVFFLAAKCAPFGVSCVNLKISCLVTSNYKKLNIFLSSSLASMIE